MVNSQCELLIPQITSPFFDSGSVAVEYTVDQLEETFVGSGFLAVSTETPREDYDSWFLLH